LERELGVDPARRPGMAAAEQLKELGEKLQAAAPAPADELAKLLEVRRPEPSGSSRAPGVAARASQPWRRVALGGFRVDLCARRGNSAGLGFRALEGAVLAVAFPLRIGGRRGCLVLMAARQFSCGEGSGGASFLRAGLGN